MGNRKGCRSPGQGFCGNSLIDKDCWDDYDSKGFGTPVEIIISALNIRILGNRNSNYFQEPCRCSFPGLTLGFAASTFEVGTIITCA